jgi:hypothetical protein
MGKRFYTGLGLENGRPVMRYSVIPAVRTCAVDLVWLPNTIKVTTD